MTATAGAQTDLCKLVDDERNPPEKILRCGDGLVVRSAHDTSYQPIDQAVAAPPNTMRLDSGAVLVDFHSSAKRRTFQILTPNAIAAVRGTRWVVSAEPARSSVFVISGRVAVSRPQAQPTVLLGPGQGVDVAPDGLPLVVKRWAAARVRTLLARFGE